MDSLDPYVEWVPDDFTPKSQRDVMRYALTRIEAQWNEAGWNQPFAVGVLLKSHMSEIDTSALSVCQVALPDSIVEDPSEITLFAQLVTQAVYQQEYRDDDFQRLLMLAAIGHPDQDLDGPRQWMRHVLERGGEPMGWFSVLEGFDGDVPDNVDDLSMDQIRALPGVQEVRALTFISSERYTMIAKRVRGQGDVQITDSSKLEDRMGFSLGLLTDASLRMRMLMDNEVA